MKSAWAPAKARKDENGHLERLDMMHRMGLCVSKKCGRQIFEKCRNPRFVGTFLECQGQKATN